MATEKTIVLITGANSGIGFELTAHLLSDSSKHVLLGSRSVEKGQAALEDLSSRNLPGTVELLLLDISIEDSITTAAKTVETKHGRLDVLINNAAIGWPTGTPGEQMALSFLTNSIGPYLLVEAFIPLLKKSTRVPRIINVSSGGGSISRRLDPDSQSSKLGMWGIGYCASKAALNYITAAQAATYGEMGIKVFAFTPGFVVSGLGPLNTVENGAQPTSEGARPIVAVVNGERDGEHAGFLSAVGQYAW